MGLKEHLRKEISKFLIDTDEQHPLKCNVIIGEDEAFGLSSLQLPRICELFQIPGEGIIYYKLEGTNDFEEIETLTKSDLTNVLNYLEENV
jgi:hypothetical protein